MNEQSDRTDPAAGLHPARHWGGFLASGLVALGTDAAVLQVATAFFGLNPLVARLIAISLAMVAAWLSHRRLTFAIATRPTLGEFLRYAAVAWTTAAINFGVFAAVLAVRPETHPVAALIIASIVATFFAYVGMRYGAFRGGRQGSSRGRPE